MSRFLDDDAASHRSVADVIAQWSRLTPGSHAISAPGRRALTYESLQALIYRVTTLVRDEGIRSCDRVATVLPNGPEAATAFLAISCCATSAPLNPSYSDREFDFYLSDLEPKAIVALDGADSPALAVAERRGISVLRLHPDTDGPAGLFHLETAHERTSPTPPAHQTGTPRVPHTTRPDNVALVLHTSGTTSRPKMVPLTHANLSSSATAIARTLELTSSDRCLNVMPLFHIHGLAASVLASLSAGGCVVCTPGFFATDVFAWMQSERATWYTAVPTMHQTLLSRAMTNRTIVNGHSLRFIRSSSASLPPELAAQLEKVFRVPVIEAYGMTEAAHQMASNTPAAAAVRKPGSVGPSAGPDIAIMDGGGDMLPVCATGEIVIRGPGVMKEYAGNPEANRLSFSSGWFRTGDQGYLDEDGYLFITGRIKEMINRGGEKIAPREIDEILFAHPDVLQAVAFAVKHPTLGEEVAAAVVLCDGSELTEQQLRTFASTRLAPFKVPSRIAFVTDIPKGPTGKLQRVGLADRLGLEPAEPSRSSLPTSFIPPATPVQKVLANIWSEVLDVGPVSADAHFLDLGGDSMLATRLVSRIRDHTGIEISLLELFDAPTITHQAAVIDRLRLESNLVVYPSSHLNGR